MLEIPTKGLLRAALAAAAVFVALGLVETPDAHAQLDTDHWIPTMWTTRVSTGNIDKHWLILTTPSTANVNVTVAEGDGTTVFSGVVSNAAPRVILLGEIGSGWEPEVAGTEGNFAFDNAGLNTPHGSGLVITASAPIYANIRNKTTSQAFSLTAKGKKALGFSFRAATMRSYNNGSQSRGNFISVMATEPNTTVTFDDITPGLVFTGTPTVQVNGETTSDTITVVLQQYESYVIGFKNNDYAGASGATRINDINGTRVSADKPIVMACGGVMAGATSSSQDMGVDQAAPENLAGTQYVLMKGNAPNANAMETVIVLPVQDNTDVFVNGSGTAYNGAPLDAGDYLWINGEYTSNDNLFLEASKPVLVYQTIGGSSSYATPGFNFIPPLGADSTTSVDNIYDVDQLGTATIGIVARAGADVFVNGSATALTGGAPVTGTPDWVTYRVTGQNGNFSVTSSDTVAVAFFNVASAIGAAGYFSGFPPTLVDLDGDGIPDGSDNCPAVSNPDQENADGDSAGDACDVCPNDPNKALDAGACGCGQDESIDINNNGTPDCAETDNCPGDPNKLNPGICGCGVPDTDGDGDSTPDCNDGCPADGTKTTPGVCGCGVAEGDSDFDGVADCNDNCPTTINPGQEDCDGDGVGAACDDDGKNCCSDGIQNAEETDIDCGGRCDANCLYGEGCNVPADCESNYCIGGTGEATCGCADDNDCGGDVCDTASHFCQQCNLDTDCAGYGDACYPESCDVDNQCVADAPTCSEPTFYGVVSRESDGALFSIRCQLIGGVPTCDMDGGELALGEPMCQ